MPFRRRRPPPSEPPAPDPVQVAAGYHQRTKHGYQAFARSLGFLDWDSQPDPFRRFDDAALQPLAIPDDDTTGYDALYDPRAATPRPLDSASLASFLYHSLALSAWKAVEDNRWSLRVNPSSGNLHPTEAYLALPAIDGLLETPALHHYAPREHALERRAGWTDAHWQRTCGALPAGAFLLALTSIPWRESWKYGERAWRYCQHDVGHALGALRLAAALMGWRLQLLPIADDALDTLLGLDRASDFPDDEPEHADLLAVVLPGDADPIDPGRLQLETPPDVDPDAMQWSGPARPLSSEHHPWEIVEVVGRFCRRPTPPGADDWPHTIGSGHAPSPLAANRPDELPAQPASAIIRGRRSAVSMDAKSPLPVAHLWRMLARVVPALAPVPWDVVPWPISVHLALFVHRVDGLDPGLYALVRDDAARADLQAAMRDEFAWSTPPDTPDGLSLFQLAPGDVRGTARSVSCGQDIAADGAFSLGMLARFDDSLAERGAPAYRELFWETGLIGQVLYLEAEAVGLRSTGIGCFFDDPVHGALGLTDSRYQSLYHFTVGGPVHDPRISDLPAYPAPTAG